MNCRTLYNAGSLHLILYNYLCLLRCGKRMTCLLKPPIAREVSHFQDVTTVLVEPSKHAAPLGMSGDKTPYASCLGRQPPHTKSRTKLLRVVPREKDHLTRNNRAHISQLVQRPNPVASQPSHTNIRVAAAPRNAPVRSISQTTSAPSITPAKPVVRIVVKGS